METQRDQQQNGQNPRLASLPPSTTSRLLLGPRPGDRKPFDSKSDRPLLQLTLRAALWGALGVGCVGGAVAILRPPGEAEAPLADPTTDSWIVPGPVSGVAEDTVLRWLTATDEQREGLASLFVEPPPAGAQAGDEGAPTLQVSKVTAVSGSRLDDGYWSVTLAVDILVPPVVDETTSTTDEPPAPTLETWYVQIGIVGDGNGGYVPLATPAVVPGPKAPEPEWSVAGDPEKPNPDDPLAQLLERFLGAMLAGSGDAAPYLAPGADIFAADPAPFASVEIVEMTTKELDDSRLWVHVKVTATTQAGVSLPLSYDLDVVDRGDRWEIETFSGVPIFVE